MSFKLKSSKAKIHTGKIKIISGQWKSRHIHVPTIDGLRPTASRTRETLFNWIGQYIIDATVLDCFTGSGILAFESLSRGAKNATLIDKQFVAVKNAQANAQLLQAKNCHIYFMDINHWIKKHSTCNQPFNLIFIDPPFHQSLALPTCLLLEQYKMIAPEAYIYVETEKILSLEAPSSNWTLYREKKTNQVHYTLWKYQEYTV